jgi:hypothetical protein
MRRDKGGKPLYRHIYIFVETPVGFLRRKYTAPPRQGFTEEGIDSILEKMVDAVEARFPTFKFRLAIKGANDFSIICDGPKDEFKPPALTGEPVV